METSSWLTLPLQADRTCTSTAVPSGTTRRGSVRPPLLRGLLPMTVLLLVVVVTRAALLNQVTFDEDEVRSAMRSFGTPAQIIAWQPDDWPPGHGLLLGAWRGLVGSHPVMLRVTSLFFGLLAVALAYRAALVLGAGQVGALLTAAAYSALGDSIFLSTYLRAYVIALALFPAALWLTVRYFRKPTVWRSLPLALLLAVLFYTTYTSVLAFLALGLYTLLACRRQVWRWVLPVAVLLVLVAPELLRQWATFVRRIERTADINPQMAALPVALADIFENYLGRGIWLGVWVVLLALALIFALGQRRRAIVQWAVVTSVIGPLALYSFMAVGLYYFLVSRYTWWALFAIALLTGLGLSRLPRLARYVVLLVLVTLNFVNYHDWRYVPLPFESVFSYLDQHARPGDVLLVDRALCLRDCSPNDSESNKFSYYYRVFAADLPLVESADDHRRIWYLSQNGWQDEATQKAVLNGRIAREFAGPWNFLVRLHEAPPDPVGVPFENGLRYHGLEVLDDGVVQTGLIDLWEQDTVTLRLWWSVDEAVAREYSVAVKALNAANHEVFGLDGAPQLVQLDPTVTDPLPSRMVDWLPGEIYVEERRMTLPEADTQNYLRLVLTVYQWWDGVRVPAPGVNADGLLPLQEFTLWGW